MSKTIGGDVPLEIYIRNKVSMLKSDFKIFLTPEDLEKLLFAGSEISVDNYAHDLIKRRLSD